MDETYTTKAIVLNRQPYRENDSRVTVCSLEYGKLVLIARGTATTKSKMAGHIEPFCFSDFMIVRGKCHSYIGGVASQNCFSAIKSDLSKLRIVGQVIAVINKLVKENEADSRLFFLLHDFLEFLDNNDIKEETIDFFIHAFVLKLMSGLGYEPELRVCVACGKELKPENNSFDFSRGGLVCGLCQAQNSTIIKNDTIKLLRCMVKEKFIDLQKLKYDKKISDEAIKNIILFYNYTHPGAGDFK
ncbi:MAG: repair protein RecO protein [Candidatus Falkowbacteria bacterium GW2011_GWC2_38_22]|uniref:DNA repair protein RecO n=1 Tax=Candidatus Falkowbacteria bacterium GW2011_GWE1_38_31 TaxID=1618638 RepID=A0A0G0M8K2_9BACT|nr:MAG: repair protein RecO protein [Candidatus Falkowbacteria bacterium GW2011_GWF2_38_1205]KKQ61218.1 MAG: repair protein RecO protein [Candidatus Falkowbacteria bacterium GW2011_GWC2_38_22]KKQ63277.1 MAG: repair protein RecO protein [Candidatus Falkowbacteria bacterium GW2011_GWF1_38_22]KKQ65605.1 MAG: repair protein RecO protein [Candidatus Falkowbacteria bacterium GW2011_GWE2_38_254]KKQ70009.1 MAG: repair protein RecO protein [Candidatus Falkowbacteria bacterium GW2011_GWE1_38_31]KKQ72750